MGGALTGQLLLCLRKTASTWEMRTFKSPLGRPHLGFLLTRVGTYPHLRNPEPPVGLPAWASGFIGYPGRYGHWKWRQPGHCPSLNLKWSQDSVPTDPGSSLTRQQSSRIMQTQPTFDVASHRAEVPSPACQVSKSSPRPQLSRLPRLWGTAAIIPN